MPAMATSARHSGLVGYNAQAAVTETHLIVPHDLVEEMRQRLSRGPDPMTLRRCTVEHPFGTIKAWMGATRFQMRGLKNVRTEMALHILAYNIKRMISLVGVRRLLSANPS
jgi:hypothetical protein